MRAATDQLRDIRGGLMVEAATKEMIATLQEQITDCPIYFGAV